MTATQLRPGGIERVLVFRALVLGDMLCATPALRALRAALPAAQITLVGMPGMRGWAERQSLIDDFIAFPGWPGLPEQPAPSPQAAREFVAALRERRFDLALQLHGSGGIVNPLVASFGAARNAGFFSAGSEPAAADRHRFLPWPEEGSEVERLLALTDHLGFPRQGSQLDFPLLPADRQKARELLAGLSGPASAFGTTSASGAARATRATRATLATDATGASRATGLDVQPRRHAVVHAGSQLPSRRWPVDRFAAVADTLAAQGLAVLLTGSAGEAPLVAELQRALRRPAHDLAGKTDLWTLGALLEDAAVLVSNDTGLSHIAAALGTPSVVVANGSDVARWAPHDAARHRIFWHDMPCRPCGHPVCPNGQACALAVPAAPVAQAALEAVRRAPAPPPAQRPGPAPPSASASASVSVSASASASAAFTAFAASPARPQLAPSQPSVGTTSIHSPDRHHA